MKVTYNTRVGTAMGHPSLVGPRVGIELEYENADRWKLEDCSPKYWHWTEDPSLRASGLEYISSPLKSSSLDAALAEVQELIDLSGAVVTKRCGGHVHVNVIDMTFKNLWTFMTLTTLMEPFIFKQFADDRENSHFCVPTWANTALHSALASDASKLFRGFTKDAKGHTLGLTEAQMTITGLAAPPSHAKHKLPLSMLANSKYSSMNLRPIEKLGTVEFRQFPCTLKMDTVKQWCDTLIRLRKRACTLRDAWELMDIVEEVGGLKRLCHDVGLVHSSKVNPEYIEDAVDAAYIMVGHKPTDPKTLEWRVDKCVEL